MENGENFVLIVGLGNPEPVYDETRHNIGFRVVKAFADKQGWKFKRAINLSGTLAQGEIFGKKILLLLPLTYMNSSGEAVKRCMEYFKVFLDRLMVVSDDIYLPFGTLRLKANGSAGGHNGLKSVQAHLGTLNYPRLKIGVGEKASGELSDHVLGRFTREEEDELPHIEDKALAGLEKWIAEGLEPAMRITNIEDSNKLDEEK